MAITVLTDGAATNNTRTLSWTIPTLAVGDVVTVRAMTWDTGITLPNPSGTGLAFGSPLVLNPGTGSRDFMAVWAMKATAAGTNVVVTCGPPSATCMHGGVLKVYPAADGYDLAGTPNTLAPGSVAQSGSMPGANGNLADWAVGDWSGTSGASRTYLASATEDLYEFSSGDSTFYFAYVTLTGATTSIGLSAPAGLGQANIGAIEILVTGGGPAPDASFQLPMFPDVRALIPGFAAMLPPPLVGFMPWAEMAPLPAVTDTAAPANLARSQSDSVTVGDTVVAGVTLARSQSESITVADTQARALAEARAQSESVTVGDATSRALAVPRAQAETVTVADSTSRALTEARSLSESVTVADTTTRSSSRSRAQAESVTVSDANARAVAEARSQAETVTISDTTAASTGGNSARNQSESVTAADTVTRALVQARAQADSVTLNDAVARSSTRSRALSESVTVTDATARAVGRFRTLSDALTLSDTVARQVNRARGLSETITLGDLATAGTTQARALFESLLITDTTIGSAHGQALDLQLYGRLAPPGIRGTLDPPPLVGHLAAPTITGRIP